MLIQIIAIVSGVVLPLGTILWRLHRISMDNDVKLNDKIDGLAHITHEGFAQNAVQHAEMSGRMDVLENDIKTLYKATES